MAEAVGVSAATWWDVNDDGGTPVSMTWQPKRDRAERRCPRTYPHEPHGPWFTGEAWRPGDGHVGALRCPGVPL